MVQVFQFDGSECVLECVTGSALEKTKQPTLLRCLFTCNPPGRVASLLILRSTDALSSIIWSIYRKSNHGTKAVQTLIL